MAQELSEQAENKYGQAAGNKEAAVRLPGPDKKIYDLVDVVSATVSADAAGDAEDVDIPSGRKIHDLVDVVKDDYLVVSYDKELEAAVMKKVTEITEKIARELVPDIAERVIREEIEKLKA